MVNLDPSVRIFIEREIDSILKDLQNIEQNSRLALQELGIEPILETVLSFIFGMILGRTNDVYQIKYKRNLTSEEFQALLPLLKRRAHELKEAFIKTRINDLDV